jgi:hypothetical protein
VYLRAAIGINRSESERVQVIGLPDLFDTVYDQASAQYFEIHDYPKVNENASTPASRNSISNVESLIGPFCRTS